MNLLKGSFFLKLAALIVALLTYNYIHREIYSVEKNASDASYKLIKLTAKNLPVKIRLDTQPPDGYRLIEEQISVAPLNVTVIGPEALLENAWNAETSLVDISDSTHSAVRRVPLESVAGIHLTGEPYLVDVNIPIEKIPDASVPSAEPPTDLSASPQTA